ncbi:MAG: sporulation initiation factor Spo0A C-terminal domain-containing protein [Defluviitaleaceae bacterium]|nr:sporulation initiation factor Spo0A C-terminal domain-containing protein [Defluviitaleaceae bacterium]
MNCENELCVYNKNYKCVLEKVTINNFSICKESAYISLQKNYLDRVKESQLNIIKRKRINTKRPTDIELKISKILSEMGIPHQNLGYYFLREAIMLIINNKYVLLNVNRHIYGALAKNHNTSRTSVERAMRHAIETAWGNGDIKSLDSFLGFEISKRKGKPTNKEFIAMIADRFMFE